MASAFGSRSLFPVRLATCGAIKSAEAKVEWSHAESADRRRHRKYAVVSERHQSYDADKHFRQQDQIGKRDDMYHYNWSMLVEGLFGVSLSG